VPSARYTSGPKPTPVPNKKTDRQWRGCQPRFRGGVRHPRSHAYRAETAWPARRYRGIVTPSPFLGTRAAQLLWFLGRALAPLARPGCGRPLLCPVEGAGRLVVSGAGAPRRNLRWAAALSDGVATSPGWRPWARSALLPTWERRPRLLTCLKMPLQTSQRRLTYL
jgi:hypothetical protein